MAEDAKKTGKGAHSRLWITLLCGLGAAALCAALYIFQPHLLQQMDRKVYDAYLHMRAGGEPSPTPAIVDIDEASLAAYGQWPWPRYLMARLVGILTVNGAASVGLDILLSEEDRSSPVQIRAHLKRDMGVDMGFTGLPNELHDNDLLLAEIFKNSPSVLGMYFRFATDSAPPPPPPGPGVAVHEAPGAPPVRARLLNAPDVVLPLPPFLEAAPVGSINMAPDGDGIVRRVPMVVRYGDTLYAGLSLRTLMRGLGVSTMILRSGQDGLESVRVGKYDIPVTPEGDFAVPFRGGRGVYPYFSAGDILEGKVPPEEIRGRVFFIGTSAAGLMDIRATPFAGVYPGVEVHASVVDAVLSRRFVIVPPWSPGMQILLIFGGGLVSALAFGFARPTLYLPLGGALAGGAIYGAGRLFLGGMFLSPLYVLLTILTEAVCILPLRFWQEERRKMELRRAFARYVAPEVVDRIVQRGEDVFAGEERELSIMFTDVRGFTSLSEKLSPRQVVTLLNRYFTPMTALVRGSGGTLDKFIGDAIMAFWNAPLDVDDHPAKAVETGIAMRETLHTLNSALEEEFGVRLNMGVGINTGLAYVGNMGSAELLDYTAIGDNVNLASRLEGLCSQYGVGLVISGAVVERCGDRFRFRFIDMLRVKGKTRPVPVYTAMRLEEGRARAEELAAYDEAVEHYRAGNFATARGAFAALCVSCPDQAIYAVYEERCARLCADPPAEWDGVWTLTKK